MTADLVSSDPARQAVAQLEALASDLTGRGFETRVSRNGETPSLDVVSGSDPSVRETVTVAPADGTWWFCWSWGDRIAGVADVEAASFKIAYVVITADQPGQRTRDIVADPNAPYAARSFVRREFGDQAPDLLTVTVELVTNALRHARTSSIGVSLQPVPGGVLVEVSDGDGTSPPQPRDASPLDESGRGLAMVAALSDRWGWRPGGPGKIVFAVVPAVVGG